jgi:phosphoribosylformylglycinamidine cyclo-ligase
MDAGRVGARADARAAYTAAGVDVAAGDRAVGLLRERISAAGAAGVDLLGGLGGFGAALELPPGYSRPVLVSATDGVGTKTEIARELGRLDTIGRDLVAMCADDVVCHGARPWLFLDYLAVGRLHPERAADLVSGIAAGCVDAGAVLVGGETAEHPGVMEADAFDLAGFCVGIVERDRLIDGSRARVGDRVIGIESSGLHANGYSLVRTALRSSGTPLHAQLGDRTLGEALLAPTTIYAPHVLAVIEVLEADGLRLGGVAHVTGGGLAGNLPRAVARDLGIHVRVGDWPVPPVVAYMADLAGLDGVAMRATFNAGVGMALVVEPAAGPVVIDILAGRGLDAWDIGSVVPDRDAGPMRYVEEGA